MATGSGQRGGPQTGGRGHGDCVRFHYSPWDGPRHSLKHEDSTWTKALVIVPSIKEAASSPSLFLRVVPTDLDLLRNSPRPPPEGGEEEAAGGEIQEGAELFLAQRVGGLLAAARAGIFLQLQTVAPTAEIRGEFAHCSPRRDYSTDPDPVCDRCGNTIKD